MKIYNLFFVIVVLLFSCRNSEKNNNYTFSEKREPEIFVGKVFSENEAFHRYKYIKGGVIYEKDSLYYNIYKPVAKKNYLLACEKLISKDKERRYKILDLYEFNKLGINVLIYEGKYQIDF